MAISLTYESLATYLRTAVDIIVVWVLVYYLLKIVKNNQRTIQLFKGILFVIIVQAIAKFLGLTTLAWLTDNIMSWGFLALIVLFQPEIRSMLERIGKTNILSRLTVLTGSEKTKLINELMAATSHLAESKTGALITIEQSHSLDDFIKTGVQINSIVSAELLTTIFDTSTPLHDGAVIIQGDKISCASAYFPPTSMDLPHRYGARHRAAIGISEITDAITIVVSEESGGVSVTAHGKIIQMNESKLRDFLNRVILNREKVAANASGNIGSESVSINDLIKEDETDDEEVEFSISDNTEASKQASTMKTFGTAQFKVTEDTKGNKLKQTSTLQKVVKETMDDTAGLSNDKQRVVRQIDDRGVVKQVVIKTVSVPAAGASGMIKTQSISQGKPVSEDKTGGNKDDGKVQ